MLREGGGQCARKGRRPARAALQPAPVEPLESRVLLSSVTFAVIGDYSAPQGTAQVAQLVKSWDPSFIVTTGDNNYPAGSAATIDANVGQFYHSFIAPYHGTYGAGSSDGANHFFPALGEHDWMAANAQPYLDYFTLPGKERYYATQQGNVGIFVLDSSSQEPDGNGPTSIQAQWLQSALASSTATWKLVFCFNPPYSSGANGNTPAMQWPFAKWGATAVISGHDQDYERLTTGGATYFVDALGGQGTLGFNAPVAGSQVRFAGDFGAMRIDASDAALRFEFVAVSGKVIDDYTLGAGAPPAAPTALIATALGSDQVGLSWRDDANDATGFTIERSTDGVNFQGVGTVPVGVSTFADKGLAAGASYVYRIRATGLAGESAPSRAAVVSTPAMPTGVVYLSDLSWASASNDFGPVQLDRSNGGQFNPAGRTITLGGTAYVKGLGAHANSTIIYDLNGQYARFLSDVGIDGEETIHGAADFQVVADGRTIYDSGVLTFQSPPVHLSLDVSGVNQLSLVVNEGGDTIDYDHADWAGARLATSAAIPAAPPTPTPLRVTESQVQLSWPARPDGSQITVQRSDDGVNFTALAQLASGAAAYADASVQPFHTYWYRLIVATDAGDSAPSNPVALTTAPAGFAFAHGIVGTGAVSMGAGALTDSYNALAGPYLAAAAGSDGSVASAGVVRLARGATVHGSAAGRAVESGAVTARRGSLASPLSYGALPAPAANDNGAIAGLLKRGSLAIKPRTALTLSSGTYVLRNLTLAPGSVLHVSGPTVIYLSGSLSEGARARILADHPADLRIVLVGPARATLGGGAILTADLYAPRSKVALAAGSALFGSVISASLSIGARAAVHYDESFGAAVS